MKFRKVPSAVRPTLQLPTAHAGRWNFPKCHLPNLATERKKRSVYKKTEETREKESKFQMALTSVDPTIVEKLSMFS